MQSFFGIKLQDTDAKTGFIFIDGFVVFILFAGFEELVRIITFPPGLLYSFYD